MSLSDPTTFFNSFSNSFFYSNGSGYDYYADINYHEGYLGAPEPSGFWTSAEMIEMTEDYAQYLGSDNEQPKLMVESLIHGLNNIVSPTKDFASWDAFNDDVMWATIALIRGYQITGKSSMLSHAKGQFDQIYARGYDTKLGGGLYWNTSDISKNSCVNGPASIAASLLASNGQGSNYSTIAADLYAWQKKTLFNSSTGAIYDNVDATTGVVAQFSLTYNQGTFIGAATLLANGDTNSPYLEDAALALNFTRTSLTQTNTATPGILNNEGGGGDAPGFKGIFMRWASQYATLANDESAKAWLKMNANQANSIQNGKGISWTRWLDQTPASSGNRQGVLNSWECSSAVSAVVNTANF